MELNRGLDPDPAASIEVSTESGRIIDINNIPGKVKQELIQEGELDVDRFIMPANMPGKKLKELREAHRQRLEDSMKQLTTTANEFKVGDFILYKDLTYEVLKTDDEKGVMFEMKKPKGKKYVWVHHSKVAKG